MTISIPQGMAPIVSGYSAGAPGGVGRIEAGVIVGIITALLTCIVNLLHARRKDRREERESAARIARLAVMKADEVLS